MDSIGSTPFSATTSPESSFSGLLEAICQNPFIKWLADQNKFVLLALITTLLLLIFVFRAYLANLNFYQQQFQYIFKGEKDLQVKETIQDSEIKIRPNTSGEFTTLFWLYISPPTEDQSSHENRIIFMRGEMTNPSIVFYINEHLNTLKCAVRITNSLDINETEDLQKIKSLKFNSTPLCQHYIVLEYPQIPVQRWVQVSVVVKQYDACLYIDNYSIDYINTKNANKGCDDSPNKEYMKSDSNQGNFTIAGQQGNIQINPDNQSVPPQRGYIKGLQLYNTALEETKIRNIYSQSPDTPTEFKYHFNRTFNFNNY